MRKQPVRVQAVFTLNELYLIGDALTVEIDDRRHAKAERASLRECKLAFRPSLGQFDHGACVCLSADPEHMMMPGEIHEHHLRLALASVLARLRESLTGYTTSTLSDVSVLALTIRHLKELL